MYARAGIQEAWLVDLNSNTITVFTEPKRGRYTQQMSFTGTDRLVSPAIGSKRVLANQIL